MSVASKLVASAVLMIALALVQRSAMNLVKSYFVKEFTFTSSKKAVILNLTIMATNDLHSAVMGVGPESIPSEKLGGFARLANYLKIARSVRFNLSIIRPMQIHLSIIVLSISVPIYASALQIFLMIVFPGRYVDISLP